MKKKILATLMAMLMTGALVGCGNSHSTSSIPAYSSSPVAAEASSETETPESSVIEGSESAEAEESRPDEEGSTEEESVEESEEASWSPIDERETAYVRADPTDDTEKTDKSTNGELHGIITMYIATDDNYSTHCYVGSVDPSTGEYKEIAIFPLSFMESGTGDIISPIYYILTDNYQESFSMDCKRFAAEKSLHDSGETHVGWINVDGTYFDLTVALNEQSQSDFNVKHYRAYGFTPDDRFVYYEESNPDQVFYVYIDNPTVKYEGNPMPEFYYDQDQYDIHGLTSVIDETRYISACSHNDLSIRNVTDSWSKPCEHFIESNERRINRTGVLSPDGTELAFWSSTYGIIYYNMYIMPMGGGEPRKVDVDLPMTQKLRESINTQYYIVRWLQ